MQVILLGNGSLQAPPVDGAALPFAEVSVQYVLDVLYDEVDGHWEERTRFKTFILGTMSFIEGRKVTKRRFAYPCCLLLLE